MRVPAADRAIGVLDDQEKLRLDADIEHKPPSACFTQGPFELVAWANRVRAGVEVQIGSKPSPGRLVGQRRISAQAAARKQAMGTPPLAQSPRRAAREASTRLGHCWQCTGQNQLALGRA